MDHPCYATLASTVKSRRKPVLLSYFAVIQGCMGLAPKEVAYADSVPPMPYGGNLDDKRIGYACQNNADPSRARVAHASSLWLAAAEAVKPAGRCCSAAPAGSVIVIVIVFFYRPPEWPPGLMDVWAFLAALVRPCTIRWPSRAGARHSSVTSLPNASS